MTMRGAIPVTLRLAPVLALAAACVPMPGAGSPPSGPCQDSAYVAMRAQPVDSLSEREYQVFREREAACLEIQRARAGADEEGQRAVPPGAVQPWMIQARVEPGSAPGEMDIVVRNESDYRVMITAVRLYECRGTRTYCGLTRPNVAVHPHQERKVLTVRYFQNAAVRSFRFEYQFEPASGS